MFAEIKYKYLHRTTLYNNTDYIKLYSTNKCIGEIEDIFFKNTQIIKLILDLIELNSDNFKNAVFKLVLNEYKEKQRDE